MQRTEKSYDTFTEKMGSVFDQILDLEDRFVKGNQKRDLLEGRFEKYQSVMKRYLSCVHPMHSFKQVSEAIQHCLVDTQFNNFIRFAKYRKWTELKQNLEDYDKGTF